VGIIPFVKKEHAGVARAIEQKLLALPPDSGILFVGVDVAPTVVDQIPTYRLLIGTDRDSGVDQAVTHLATLTLSEELLAGADIQIEVRRGCGRA